MLNRIFGKKKKIEPQNAGFENTPMGIAFKPVWERKNQPTAGALVYAWETYGLVPFTMIGTGIRPTAEIMATQAPMFTQQGAIVTGLPIISGTLVLDPLLNPQNAPVPGQV